METKLTILKSFFENPNKEFHIREISRIVKINHTTVRQHLNKLVKEGYLSLAKSKLYLAYKLNISKKTLNLKLYYNLEKIRKSGLIEDLEKYYDYPVIVLFGSYAQARDDSNSDMDLCIISSIKKEFNTEKYKKALNRDINIRQYNKNSWEKSKKSNSGLINNICNGIILSGGLEAI